MTGAPVRSIDVRFESPDVPGDATGCLLPVTLSGGVELVVGTWLVGGAIANDIAGLGLLGAPVTTTVRDPGEQPWVTGSSDPAVAAALAAEWDRDEVLAYFPCPLPVAVRTPVSAEWSVERSPDLASRVTDGTLQFAGPGRTVYVDQLVDEACRAPEEFLGDLIAAAPAVPAEHTTTTVHGDEVRHTLWQEAVVDDRTQHEVYGHIVRPGTALAVSCFHDDPTDHEWALRVINSTTYLA
jgi:hypothetical protein